MKNTSISMNMNIKTIKDFNRQCKQQNIKNISNQYKKYEKRIQNYIIDMSMKIGQGTFSKVYKGKDIKLGNEVAIKIIELKKIQQMGISKLFWNQLNIIKKLKHPNIITCYQYFKTINNCYTIYQLCDDGDLGRRIKKGHLGDRQDIHQANLIIKDVFQGLLYLQSINIIHRDIKAANIFISKGKAKIGDFGFAIHSKREFKDVSIGSPAYMAPEGLLKSIYGPKTDVWAFGMLIYELLHGQTPFYNCESEQQLKQRIQIPVNWDQLKGSLCSPLKRLILKCLKVDFEQRPTFSQLLNDEYIQKIYQQGNTYRQSSKSNYTRLTADSQQLQIREIKMMRQQRQMCMMVKGEGLDDRKVQYLKLNDRKVQYLKTEQNEDGGDDEYLINKVQQNRLDDERDKLDMVVDDRQEQLKKLYVQKYMILIEQRYSDEYIILQIDIAVIYLRTINLLRNLSIQININRFDDYVKQLVCEIYSKIMDLKRYELLQRIKQLKIFNKQFMEMGLADIDIEYIYKSIDGELFEQIKRIQMMIDRQDIRGLQIDNNRSLLIQIGNLLIISWRIINSQNRQMIQLWINNTIGKLDDSEQFYIWLYELQLQRMQR